MQCKKTGWMMRRQKKISPTCLVSPLPVESYLQSTEFSMITFASKIEFLVNSLLPSITFITIVMIIGIPEHHKQRGQYHVTCRTPAD